MGLYDILADIKIGARKVSHTNVGRFFLLILGLLSASAIRKPWNFQSGIIGIMNKPLPIITEYTFGMVFFIVAIIGIVGFWRKKL